MSTYSIDRNLEGSFAVTSEFIQSFCELAQSFTGKKVTLTAEYSSGHTEVYSDDRSFLDNPWLHANKVVKLTISSGDIFGTSVQLKFSNFLISTVSLRISGNSEGCLAMELRCVALLASVRTYIRPLHSARLSAFLLGGCIAAFGLVAHQYSGNVLASTLLTIAFTFIFVNIVLFFLPKYEIQIGRGKKSAGLRRLALGSLVSFLLVGAAGAIYQDAIVGIFKNISGERSSASTDQTK